MKKLLLFLVFLSAIFILNPVNAACPTEGIVPCGTPDCPCTFCHFFVLLDKIIKFVLFQIVPPLAVLMFVIGGVTFLFASGNPGTLENAKKILTAAVIGLVVIYGAWVIINTFFTMIGVADWTGLKSGWFQFNCPTQ